MTEQAEIHVCSEEGCSSTETSEYTYPFSDGSEWLCWDHAIEGGFCVWCQQFASGSEDFDFNGIEGYHTDCYRQLQAEVGEDLEDDDEGWGDYDFYPHSWHDPDLSVEEDSTHTYIGKDREDLG